MQYLVQMEWLHGAATTLDGSGAIFEGWAAPAADGSGHARSVAAEKRLGDRCRAACSVAGTGLTDNAVALRHSALEYRAADHRMSRLVGVL